MNTKTCELRNTEAYLQREMSQRQEHDYILHLDACSSCRARLESLAADEQQWSDIQDLLTPAGWMTNLKSSAAEAELHLPLAVRQAVETLAPSDDPESLGRIDSFEVTGVVGSGAMGVVLKAVDPSLKRVVALKVMNPALATSGAARARFAREAKAAAAILHPNVIAIHGVSTTAALPYLVMPYLKGITLQQRVDRQGPLSVAEVLRIGSQIASGLEAAHQQGVIHRDIKPSNIMLDAEVEAAVITDFGLARTIDDATMTRTGVITGTPEFMSPEQARGELIDGKSDLFSLGSLLYMLCTGHPPFRAQTSFGVLRRITDDEPKPIRSLNSEIPHWLCRMIESLQAKSADARPTAAETHSVFESCLAHVYQPDQIPLPEACRALPLPPKSKFVSPIYLGAIAMLAPVALFASLFFLPATTDDTSGGQKGLMPTTIKKPTGDSAKVFKTLNLDFPNPNKRGEVVVDINRGFVEVTTHDEPNVIIEILYPPNARKSSDQAGMKLQFAPSFDLDTDKQRNRIKLDTYNQDYVLNLHVKVPKQTNLSLDSYYDGYLKVVGVEGTILTDSQHCDITLQDISGSAQAYSRNGNIKISFVQVAADAELDFESYNGSIDVSFPQDTGMIAAISTGRGKFGSEFELEPTQNDARFSNGGRKLKDSEYYFSKINGGGIPLRIEGENGIISLRKSTAE